MSRIVKDFIGWALVLFILILCLDYATSDNAAAASTTAYRQHIIRVVWGGDAALGVRIAGCESTWNPAARDGADWGLYQESPYNRRVYGWGSGSWAQALSGYKLFKALGTMPWVYSKRCWNV